MTDLLGVEKSFVKPVARVKTPVRWCKGAGERLTAALPDSIYCGCVTLE